MPRKGNHAMSWAQMLYGALLSGLAAAALAWLAGGDRRPLAVALTALSAVLGPLAWNAILRAAHGDSFFTDAPIVVFPISWQDTGSGVFAIAAGALILGAGPLRAKPAAAVTRLAALAGLGALLVDIYLY
jgi:hypothetical protein